MSREVPQGVVRGTPGAVSKKGLIHSKESAEGDNNSKNFASSVSLAPSEIQRLLDVTHQSKVSFQSTHFLYESMQNGDDDEQILIDSKEKSDLLYTQFLEILRSRTNETEVFDTIQDLIQTCSGVLGDIIKDTKGIHDGYKRNTYKWMEDERNTWRLLYALYKDRILVQKEDIDCDGSPFGGSEKDVVNQLYSSNGNLREYQLIVDWLESCALEKNDVQASHFSDRTVGWENTLFQLQNPAGVSFSGGLEIVHCMDPDAPVREKKPLHPLDVEDQTRLTKHIFLEIRQGRIEEAKALCEFFGQPWRAAILEGWRLYEDPNNESVNINEKLPIEGNPRRDLWKKCAWMMADNIKFDEFTRAASGALCGHLESLISVLDNSWEDLLWAYLKVQIDIRVESEIRSCCAKSYLPMPESYWNSKMTLEEIFEELSVHKTLAVRSAAASTMCLIQKFLILDNVTDLLDHMLVWIEEQTQTPHMLRFLTHIVLFMRQTGKIDREEVADKIIKAYVERLIDFKDPQLISFYAAALPREMQIILYSRYLERVKDRSSRCLALEEALSAGLDVEAITCHTVENIRNCQFNENSEQLQAEVCDLDEEKISALEWLSFYPQQKGELLWQANAMIRTFLAEAKIECVRKVFKIIPSESIEHIISTHGARDNLPCEEECSIKEYLCHQTYLAAIDGFNDWTHLYHDKPVEPNSANPDANFAEKIAYEHKEQTYRAEVERWNMNLMEQSRTTRDLLFNVLLFPDKGWLVDPDTAKEPNDVDPVVWQNRTIQLENIRKLCIPEVVLLLHQVLHLSGQYKECLRLSDELASEQRQLYKVYSKHKLAEILAKIAESSLALMNEKLDPWGYSTTI